MKSPMDHPFETIESAHDFVTLLSEVIGDAKRELEADVSRESGSNVSRRLDALRLALYSLERLQLHMNRSGRILNDLRTLRRLLFEERATRNFASQTNEANSSPAALVGPPSLAEGVPESDDIAVRSFAA